MDLVPAYKIEITAEQKIISSVDRTPLHTVFVTEHLNEKQRDEVRLLKRFMKGVGTYGADVRTEGFSGYLCELLIIKYGDFESVLRATAKWKTGTVLDLGGAENKRFNETFVFMDPVDAGRNVASAVSPDSFGLFIHASSEFLKAPDIKFFFPDSYEALSFEKLEGIYASRGTDIIYISAKRPDVIDDVLYPQIKKFLRSAMRALETEDFLPMGSFYHVTDEEIEMIIELQTASLPPMKKHEGPPVWVKNSAEFLERWKNNCIKGPYIEGGRWFADIERRYPDAVLFLKERFADMLGKDIPPAGLIRKMNGFFGQKPRTLLLISKYLEKKFPWEW